MCGVAFHQDLSFFHPVTFEHDRPQVDAGVLVGSPELDQVIGSEVGIKAHQLLVVGPVVIYNDLLGIHVVNYPVSFRHHQCSGVTGQFTFQPGTYNRRFGAQQRHGLALHVRSHQGPVGIIMLQVRDHGSGDRHDLVRRDVHVLDIFRRLHGEVSFITAFQQVYREVSVIFHVSGSHGNVLAVFFLRGQVFNMTG
ncbi:hypothetical protein D9M68_606240 [compost metagenome]